MEKIPKKKRKVTELYFNEYDGTNEVYTYSKGIKKRLTTYAATHPDQCRLAENNSEGGLRFEIDKHHISIRPTVPYSYERRIVTTQQTTLLEVVLLSYKQKRRNYPKRVIPAFYINHVLQ